MKMPGWEFDKDKKPEKETRYEIRRACKNGHFGPVMQSVSVEDLHPFTVCPRCGEIQRIAVVQYTIDATWYEPSEALKNGWPRVMPQWMEFNTDHKVVSFIQPLGIETSKE